MAGSLHHDREVLTQIRPQGTDPKTIFSPPETPGISARWGQRGEPGHTLTKLGVLPSLPRASQTRSQLEKPQSLPITLPA